MNSHEIMKKDFVMFLSEDLKVHLDFPLMGELDDVLDFLMENNFFSEASIKRYTVKKKYKSLDDKGTTISKMKTIKDIAINYEIHENTVWNILKNTQ